MKKNNQNLIGFLLLFILPTIMFIVSMLLTNSYIFSIEMFLLLLYFIFIIYFTKDLFSPFTFFFVNIFLGIVDIFFVATKYRSVVQYYPLGIYEKSLFLILIWLFMFYVGFNLKYKNKTYTDNKTSKITDEKKHHFNYSLIIASSFILLFLILKVFSTIKNIGKLSMDIAFFDGQGFLVAMFPICGFIPICFMEEKNKKLTIISAILVFLVIAMSGRRLVAITTTIFPILTYYNYKIKKIKVKNLYILAIPIIFFVFLIGNIRMQKSIVYNENPILNTAITLGKYIQYGENLPDLIYSVDNKKVMNQGFKYTFRGVSGLIPRGIWKDKPEIDYSSITSKLVYGYDRGYGQPVGQFGWAYLCFGYLGVILSGLITGVISNKVYGWMRKRNDAFSIGLYSLLIMQIINIFTPESQLKILLFIIFIFFVKIFNSIRRRKV